MKQQQAPKSGDRDTRKPYQQPKLTPRGDVRDVTLGPTPGVGESGNPGTLRP
ncbi:MAG: lasso RiPP family leader peptide-containing protein [Lysobacterales bacterium]